MTATTPATPAENPTEALEKIVFAAQAFAMTAVRTLVTRDDETHDAVKTLLRAMKTGRASLEVRVDLESCTARLLAHDEQHGEVELMSLVPGPTAPPNRNA